ncbi:DNA-formamidopyrimidine glycosylase [Paenibacillus nanensis]|uniref:Formamidopyrimidine-DNA glycosylase n=1 Tax=Paenibacillus nanensis TaxID=393251 RepID=A0A3A1UPI8_9BACL|nr:DNA-formamidopyrimidine glycosylase [Paenibacillus nanensis]RIX50165.1 DNA-formamidopyrimidine glycosylase [Paenibacillus nanensis]
MPELPEMETYKNLLNERIAGKIVRSVEVTREKTVNVPVDAFKARVAGRRLVRVDRRAKMLLFRLDSGDSLALHLMLGGSMFYGTPEEAPERTAQVTLSFENGRSLYFHGLRLGYLHIYAPSELEEKLGKLGPDPLDPQFGPNDFIARLRKSRRALKFALTDQNVIAGIGNCYADEMCFAAAIHPLRKLGDIPDSELHALFGAMHSTLAEAIRYGGYMETPLYAGDALTGGYNDRCKVYDRGGEPCFRCGTPITKTESNGRKVFFCERCQRQGGERDGRDGGNKAEARRLSYQH